MPSRPLLLTSSGGSALGALFDHGRRSRRITKRFVAFIEKKAADKLRVAMKIASS